MSDGGCATAPITTAEARKYVESQGEGWRERLEQAISTSVKERAPDMAGRIAELLLQGPAGDLEEVSMHTENCSAVLEAPSVLDRPKSLARRFTVANMDPKIIEAKYAVRGTVAVRAGELKGALQRGDALPFDRLTLCNIGNPHAVQQKPITYYRQVAPSLPPLLQPPSPTPNHPHPHPHHLHHRQVASALYSPELTKEGGGALASLVRHTRSHMRPGFESCRGSHVYTPSGLTGLAFRAHRLGLRAMPTAQTQARAPMSIPP